MSEERLATIEVRRRAVSGATIEVLRGFIVRLLGLVGMLVLARLLTPRDFGLVAIGLTFITFGNYLADGGIGTALIRRTDPPARADLRAVLAFQLALTSVFSVGVGLAVMSFGQWGTVTALMVMTLPVLALRVPGVILLERALNYRPLALVDLVETVFYFTWAIALVVEGWGVWALASASIVRSLVGTVLLLAVVPSARLFPSPSWSRVRPLLGFGFRYQSVSLVHLLREQGINVLIVAIAGVSALGVWSVAYRILQIPILFLSSLWRVSFPGMSRLVPAQSDIGGTLGRVVIVVAVATGALLAPLVAATPAWIPALFGQQWTAAVPVIPLCSLHLMLVGPISVALVGYLWAMGDASAVFRATLISIPLTFLVMIPLLTVIGLPAVGLAWLVSGFGEAAVLIMSARRYAEFAITPSLLPQVVCAVAGGALGWLLASHLGPTAVAGVAGALAAVAFYLTALWMWRRSYVDESARIVTRGLRDVLNTRSLR